MNTFKLVVPPTNFKVINVGVSGLADPRNFENFFKLMEPIPSSKCSKLVCLPRPVLATLKTLKTLKLMGPLPGSTCSKLALRPGDQIRADE